MRELKYYQDGMFMRNRLLRNRSRDGRVWLPRHALLVMTVCEALGTMYRQRRLPFCCRLARIPMVNDSEPAINPVRALGRKVVIRPAKRQADSRRCLSITFFPSIVQSGDSRYLRELINVNHMEHGKPDEPHMSGIPTVRKGDGSAGIGCWKKRMLNCNGSDRGCYFSRGYPVRKDADFQQV